MILVIGGAYQGKTEFVRERFGLSESDVFVCTEDTRELPGGKRVYAHIEQLALGLVREGRSPEAFWAERVGALNGAVLISEDVSGGLVPMDAVLRAWREESGRANNLLARNADEVWRVFCGLGQQLK